MNNALFSNITKVIPKDQLTDGAIFGKIQASGAQAASKSLGASLALTARVVWLQQSARRVGVRRHVAQWESASLTRKRSAVQSRPCLPVLAAPCSTTPVSVPI